jgi:hypothetical protein
MMMFELEPRTRKWIYGIIAALVPLLITFGSLSDEVGKELLGVAAAILAIGGSALAIKNVPDED